eukprot:4648906-Prorocentrum_lima.AAC.1
MDPALLVHRLQGDLLRRGAKGTNQHYSGLQQFARRNRHILGPRLVRRLILVDSCAALLRHITEVSCCDLTKELELAFAPLTSDDPHEDDLGIN